MAHFYIDVVTVNRSCPTDQNFVLLHSTKACDLEFPNSDLAKAKKTFNLEFILGKFGRCPQSSTSSAHDVMSAWMLTLSTVNKISLHSNIYFRSINKAMLVDKSIILTIRLTVLKSKCIINLLFTKPRLSWMCPLRS